MPIRTKIIHAVYTCKKCDDRLISHNRHDFVSCQCGNFVDGGVDYERIGGKLSDLVRSEEEMTLLTYTKEEQVGRHIELMAALAEMENKDE